MERRWRYEIRSGHLYDPAGVLRGIGYAGAPVAKNNPDWCDVPEKGPLPPGLYSIGPAYDHEHLGPVTMNLDPLPGTDTHGRSLFRIHPDSIARPGEASKGCIVFRERHVRELLAASECRVLEVVED